MYHPCMSRQTSSQQAEYTRAHARSVLRLNQCAADITATPPQSGMSLAQRDNFDRVANMAREAYNIGKEILGELNVEDKIYTVSKIATPIQPDWHNNVAPILLNAVPQSVNEAGRTGDSLEMRGIRLTLRLIRNSAFFNNNYVRVFLVYYDCQRPVTVQNFPTTAGSQDGVWDYELGLTAMAPAAQKDYDSKAKFSVIWDKTFKLTQDDPEILFHDFIKLKNRPVQFENDSSAVNTGALEIMFVGDQAASATVTGIWHTRLYFVDN